MDPTFPFGGLLDFQKRCTELLGFFWMDKKTFSGKKASYDILQLTE
jgi:hypothetical protein